MQLRIWMLAAALTAFAHADDNLKIMNPDAGIFPYDNVRLVLTLTQEKAAPGERQAVRLEPSPKGGYAGVTRPMVAAIHAFGNWTDYDRVQFWACNTNARDVEMHFNVKTTVDGKLVNGMCYFKLKPGEQVVTFRLEKCMGAGKTKPNLADVSHWLFAFDEGFEAPIYVGSIQLLRCAKRLPLDGASASNWAAPAEGLVVPDGNKAVKLTFPASAAPTRLWWPLPHAKATPYQTAEAHNIWRGYEKLALSVNNENAEAVSCTILLSDLTAEFLKAEPAEAKKGTGKPAAAPSKADELEYDNQLARASLVIPPGKNVVEIALSEFKIPNDARDIYWDDIRGLGIESAAANEPRALLLDSVRLLTTSACAGALPRPAARLRCLNCGLGISDVNAPQCPACGNLYREKPHPFEPNENSVRIAASSATPVYRGFAVNGENPQSLGIGHYDQSKYDNRVFLQFNLAELKIPEGSSVETVELLLYPSGNSAKPYLAPVDVYSVESNGKDWSAQPPAWTTQPAPQRWLFTGGLYRPHPEVVRFDLTDYIKEKLNGDKRASLLLKAITAGPCAHDNHMMGHYLIIHSLQSPDAARHPCLYVVYR